jgi:hypothetical protein
VSWSNIIDGVRGLVQAKAETAEEQYRALTIKLADGKATKPADVLAVLTAVGKTPDDLAADVQARLSRRQQHARYALLPGLGKERQEKEAAIRANDAELEAVTQRLREASWPLQVRLADIEVQERAARALRPQMIASCDEPALLKKRDAAQQALAEAGKRQQAAYGQLRELQGRNLEAEVSRRKPEWEGPGRQLLKGPGYNDDLAETKKQYYAALAQAEAEQVRADAALRQAEQALAAVEEELANWTA